MGSDTFHIEIRELTSKALIINEILLWIIGLKRGGAMYLIITFRLTLS